MPACFVGCQEQQELYKASKVLSRPSVREADRHILSSLHHGKPGYNLVTGSTIDFGVTWPLSLWRHSSVDPFSRPAKQQFSYRSCKSGMEEWSLGQWHWWPTKGRGALLPFSIYIFRTVVNGIISLILWAHRSVNFSFCRQAGVFLAEWCIYRPFLPNWLPM